MRSKTIGSATAGNNTGGATADYTTVTLWHASIADVDDETGTIITSAASVHTSALTVNAANTAARAYLLTADSTQALNAPTNAAAAAKARVTATLTVTGTGWTFERFGSAAAANQGFVIQAATVLRRLYVKPASGSAGILFNGGSGTSTIDNVAIVCLTSSPGVYLNNPGAGVTVNAYHVSVLHAATGFGFRRLTSGTLNVYAGVSLGGGTCFSGTIGGDDHVSQDTTAPGATNWKSQTDAYASTTGGSEDLTLAAWAQNRYGATDRSGTVADLATDIAGTARAAPFNAGASAHTTNLSSTLLTGLLASYEYQEAAAGARHNWHSTDVATDGLLADFNTVAQGTGHVSAFCGDFTAANSEHNKAAVPSLRRGHADHSGEVWVYLKDKAANYRFVINRPTSGADDYDVAYLSGADRFRVVYRDTAGNRTVTCNTFGSPSAATWYRLAWKYDAAAKTVYAKVGDGAWDSDTSANAHAANADGTFEIGGFSDSVYANALIGPVRLWSSLLSDGDFTTLWNGGAGLPFPLLPTVTYTQTEANGWAGGFATSPGVGAGVCSAHAAAGAKASASALGVGAAAAAGSADAAGSASALGVGIAAAHGAASARGSAAALGVGVLQAHGSAGAACGASLVGVFASAATTTAALYGSADGRGAVQVAASAWAGSWGAAAGLGVEHVPDPADVVRVARAGGWRVVNAGGFRVRSVR